MKHYFKYNNGYINIDNENLYLTKTGNWQEVRDIKESNSIIPKKKITKLQKVFSWIISSLLVVLCLFNIFYDFEGFLTYFFGLLLIESVILIFHKRDFGKQALIPLNQIEAIELYQKNGLKINFKNVGNEPDFEILKGIEEKGNEFLKKLIVK